MQEKYLKKLEFNEILNKLSDFSTTYIGKNLAKNLLPSKDFYTVSKLLDETSEAVSLVVQKKCPPFIEISDTSLYIKILESSSPLSAKALLEIAQILKLAIDLKNYYYTDNEESETKFPILEKLFSCLYTNPHILDSIRNSILDENTISDDASKNLSDIRRKKRNLEENIKNKLNSFIHSSGYSKYIQEALITIRNDRYVIPVKEEYRSMIKGFIHDTSSSGSTVFIEPLTIFELNNEINNLKADENIEIEKILLQLSSLLFPIVSELKLNIDIIGKLDFIFAKANYAISIDASKPNLNNEKYIDLISARHPLIDKNTVVPISLNIGKNFSTLVVTGPNTGGKTVTLKTVGLLVLMACSGLHIPANEHSSIYVFDNVFADIGDEQSIQESLSTFSSHMSNIVEILNSSTENSLVLLDELGSGTDPIEGSSLAISILENFHNKGLITLSTTHYPEIKNYVLVTDGFENASVEFDIENLRPTYKLLLGIPGKSNAFAISKKLGLNEDILSRASLLIDNNAINIEELLKNIYDNKIAIEREKENIEKNSIQVKNLRTSLENKNNLLKEKEQDIISKAKNEARQILLDAKNEASSTIKEINKIYDNIDNSSIKSLNNIRNKLNNSIKDTISTTTNSNVEIVENRINPSDIKLGIQVFITNLNQYGTILSLPNKSNQVQVQIGSAKMNISIDNLILTNNKSNADNVHYSSNSSHSSFKSKTTSSEINVIGYNVEEAIFVIDKYLDDCYIAKLNTVRIVHGKGTGILRKGIHDFLKKNSHVKSFRLGTFGEGEMGVTVVELK